MGVILFCYIENSIQRFLLNPIVTFTEQALVDNLSGGIALL